MHCPRPTGAGGMVAVSLSTAQASLRSTYYRVPGAVLETGVQYTKLHSLLRLTFQWGSQTLANKHLK